MPKITIDYDFNGIPRKNTEDIKIKIVDLTYCGGRFLAVSGYGKNEMSLSIEDTELEDVIQFKGEA
jgi:hypothetical protein